jgi:gamma-tubulin complex component 5
VVKRLRHHNFLRTNHFDVEHRLDGLEERFRVQHREGLAEALRQRLNEFSKLSSKWHPELLHFLLELSDQPTQNTRLSDLDLLKIPEEEVPPALTWEEIAREDGWNDDPAIWKSIDYSDSSDEDIQDDSKSTTSEDSVSTSLTVSGLPPGSTPQEYIVKSGDSEALLVVQESQSWRLRENRTDTASVIRKTPVTEFKVAREVLFMLHGLQTTIFDEKCLPLPTYQLCNISWDTYRALITSFSESGRDLLVLRAFVKRRQSAPHIQVFHACVESRLQEFDRKLTALELPLVAPLEDVVVSLVSLAEKLKPLLEPLRSLGGIVRQLQEAPSGAFQYLELLFVEVGVAQLGGRSTTYEFLGRIFFECFRVYLRPIRLWMEDGQLVTGDKLFFVSASSTQVPMTQIWQDQFKLRRTADGKLHAPNFLQPSGGKIFTAGKSIVVLKHLGKLNIFKSSSKLEEPLLEFDTVCHQPIDLIPFSELFSSAFEQWIQSKHQATSVTLKQELFDSCGLWSNLHALEYIYLLADGSVADTFLSGLFRRLESGSLNWHDRYGLTALAQEAFSSRLDPHKLSVTVSLKGQLISGANGRDSVKQALPEIEAGYRLAWPIQMILSDKSIAHYRSIFTFLLQIRRVNQVLNTGRLVAEQAVDKGNNWDEHGLYFLLRSKMIWFCNTIQTYLTTLVLVPGTSQMQHSISNAADVDAMIAVHSAFTKQILDEACLGAKLAPIHESFLDVLDLALKLQSSHARNAISEAEELQEISRLSVISSPLKASPKRRGPGQEGRGGRGGRGQTYAKDSDDEDADDPFGGGSAGVSANIDGSRSYMDILRGIRAGFERNLKFITAGLRGVARATSDPASAKWDMLAEMLETGTRV